MTARQRLTERAVIDAAAAVVDAEGTSSLTLSRVARELGIKPPSLYNHVSGLDAIRRNVALRVVDELGSRLAAAAMGRAGRDALRAVAAEFRAFATAHPGLYEMSAQARPDDDEYTLATMRAVEPVIAILRAYELSEEDAIHATRAMRAALHGFVALESMGGFGLDVDIDRSFAWLVEHFARTLEATRTSAPARPMRN